jgi:nucleoside-diphosphate-sugar epimerase
MNNTIEACKRAKAKLIIFDNVYPYRGPCRHDRGDTLLSLRQKRRNSRADSHYLVKASKDGRSRCFDTRSADFYGPRAIKSVLNILVFDKLSNGASPSRLIDDSLPHSFTFTPDAAQSLVIPAGTEAVWNQTWHVPTAPNPPPGKEIIQMVATEFGIEPKYRILSRPLLKIAGLFASDIRESYEMLYQNDSAYLFDSTKFSNTFKFAPTSYVAGVKCTAGVYKSPIA